MSNYPQNLLTCAIASKGDRTIPPATAMSAGTGRLSQEEGWGSVNQQAISQGGIPPYREDFNGAFYLLSQFLLWYQQGGLMNYSTDLDYEVGNEVLHLGTKYKCIQENGKNSQLKTPGVDTDYWENSSSTVLYVAQALNDGQKTQARANIGAVGMGEAASSADKLSKLITIMLTGDVTGSVQTDLSGSVQISTVENVAQGILAAFTEFAEEYEVFEGGN